MRYFETKFLEETNEFLDGLDVKTIKKILYNIDLAEQTIDLEDLDDAFEKDYDTENLKDQDAQEQGDGMNGGMDLGMGGEPGGGMASPMGL